jgi:hypothetical protein
MCSPRRSARQARKELQMQACQGYYDFGKFTALDGSTVMWRGKAILVFDDAVAEPETPNEQLEAFNEFIDAIRACDEEPPNFERAQLSREIGP